MTVFPAGNPGVYPPDFSSDVGKFRVLANDLEAEEYDPPVEGIRNYGKFSDAEVEALLAQADGSPTRAVGFYYLQLASQAAMESKSVKDYDLQVDLTKRSGDLRELALLWFGRADDEDAASGEDAMVIVPVGPRNRHRHPEATIRPLF